MRGLIFIVALFGAIAGVASPIFQKLFIDQVVGVDAANPTQLEVNLLGFLTPMTSIFGAFVSTVIAQALGQLCNFLSIREGSLLQRLISEEMYKKTLSIRSDSFGSTTVGEVVSIYATDIAGGTALIDQVLPMVAVFLCNFVFGPLAVYWICGISLWATIGLMFIVFLMTAGLAFRQSYFFGRYKQLAAERTGIVNEWIQSIRLLRILGWVESFEKKIFHKRKEETANRLVMLTNGQVMNAFGASINFVLNLVGIATLLYLSGRRVSPGELFAMLWIFGVFLSRSFRQLPWFITFALDSVSSLRRLESFLARKSDAGDVEATEPRESFTGETLPLSIRDLNLSINGQQILHDVSFDVVAGEFAAIIGEVGSGKSLLVLSLMGETGATFGRFDAGDVNMLALDVNERRRYFSFVPQEGFVMSASLRENVIFRYSDDDREDDGISTSLRYAQFNVADEIHGPGLLTEIGERGVNLSGGQRQRISLARARHFRRPIVLLDDCLSAVDVDTEKRLVADLLDGDWKGRTRLLITHRLSVLARVQKIFFMENGRIVETGTFDELTKKSRRMQEFLASVKQSENKDSENTTENLIAGIEERGTDVGNDSIS